MGKAELGIGSLGFVSITESKKDDLGAPISASECTDTAGCDNCNDCVSCQDIAIARSPKTEVIFVNKQK